MKRLFLGLLVVLIHFSTFGQVNTLQPSVGSANSSAEILAVTVTDNATIVVINFYDVFMAGNSWVSISSSTTLSYSDPTTKQTVSIPAMEIRRGENFIASLFDQKYTVLDFGSVPAQPMFQIVFGPIPPGVNSISISENVRRGLMWSGIRINPRQVYSCPSLGPNVTKNDINDLISNTNNPFRGYYESIDNDYNYQLALLNHNGSLVLVYVSDTDTVGTWETGDVMATMRQSSSPSVYKADWYLADKSSTNSIISFDEGIMSVRIDGEIFTFIKMASEDDSPWSQSSSNHNEWFGSGFALLNGYIVTNYHVIEGAKSIKVHGVKGEMDYGYSANVVATDKVNDIAIIKISDSHFSGFGSLPYAINNRMADVGEDVWVLGYPLSQVLGNEVKLTNGLVSSRSGYQGDVATYQISAPVQPGNSGGPLFDSKGNIIGIVNAGVPGAENVGYAIKTSYLKNLVDSYSLSSILPTSNSISSLALKEQVKRVRNFVFLLSCSSEVDSSINPIATSSSLNTKGTPNSSSTSSLTKKSKSQRVEISGVVRSSYLNSLLIGAKVTILGTEETVRTNSSGQYTIKASPEDVLIFSDNYHETVTRLVGNKRTINVTLTKK